MKICIDVRSPGTKGVFSVINCLLNSLSKVDKNNEYFLITDSKHKGWGFDEATEIVVPSLSPWYWMIWSNTLLPKLLEKNKVDVYHSLKHVTAFRLKAKKIVTFHGGPTLYRFPEFYTWHDRMYWKVAYSMAARKYDRVITGAEAEKRYFTEKLGYPEKKFRVTYLAANERFRVTQDDYKLKTVKNKFNLPDQFILYVGQMHRRKNIDGIIKGYYKSRHGLQTTHKLVLVGSSPGSYFQEMLNLVENLGIREDVLFLPHIPEEDLPYVYNLADLFLFPSHYESFGIVLLEAMACGLAVITSDIEDIDEVVGNAAIRVNPTQSSEIAEAIVEVLSSNELRQSLTQKSLDRSRLFSWDRCARETIKIYNEVAQA